MNAVARFTKCAAIVLIVQSHGNAQHYVDRYLIDPLIYTTIGTSADGLDQPRDLDFKPNSNELWVVNYASGSGGTTVIYFDAGESTQSAQFRKDSHSDHFMPFPSAIAFSNIGEWATVGEAQNSNFMGPSLWLGDTAIYARVFQNNWATGYPLGSHIDMLHQSPFSMGLAHDSAKVYWVADGHHSNICKYDYVMDHSPGYDDHSAGMIWRYTDVSVTRVPGVPGHMVLDKATNWLYIVNAGTKQVFRMNTATGSVTGNLIAPNEYLASYKAVTGATKEVIANYSSQPCGIEFYNDRLLVGDYATGEIRVYNTAPTTPTLMGTITTGQPGIMGLKVGPDGKIWFVNKTQNTLVRIDPQPASLDASISRIVSPALSPFEPSFYSPHFNNCDQFPSPVVELVNRGTTTLTTVNIELSVDGGVPSSFGWTGSLAPGASQLVTLPAMGFTEGEHKLVAAVVLPNGSQDLNPANDKKEGSFRARSNLAMLPFSEGFSMPVFPPPGWSVMGYNKFCFMSRVANNGTFLSPNGCLEMNNTSGVENISGQVDYLMSPRIDLTQTGTGTTLDFEVAHAQYNSSSNDRLEVLVSDDCGNTWTSAYNKAGVALSTTVPTTANYSPQIWEWRKENVSLDPFLGKEVLILFKTTSDFGNNVYVDDININQVPISVPENRRAPELLVFPNPAGELINVVAGRKGTSAVRVVNILGEDVTSGLSVSSREGSFTFDVSRLAAGTYFAIVQFETGSAAAKLIVAR